MLDKVRSYIEKENLFADNSKIVVGLSGGMDSMVLLTLLIELDYSCIAAHCNFHLRGDESDRDAAFVKSWCKTNNITLVSTSFHTVEYAAQNKISIEMAARDLRYGWFEEVRNEYNADYIAVAHHKDDSIETVLMNLIRGTGIKGLTGIPPKNGFVSRPLLTVLRSEIEDYVTKNEIPYVTDSTNKEDIYVRNLLRLRVLPIIEEINPSVRESIYRTSQNLLEVEKIYNNSIIESIKAIYKENAIDINKLKKQVSPKSVLFEILSPLGLTPSTIEDIFESMNSESGKVFYSDHYRVIKDRETFIIDKLPHNHKISESYSISSDFNEVTDPINLKISKVSHSVEIQKNRNFLYADADKLLFPLTLRKWKKGDWFIPFGMTSKKKLSDFFTDKKYSIKDKEEAWILTSGNDIVWVVGERPDNRFKITNHTKNIIIVEFVEKGR